MLINNDTIIKDTNPFIREKSIDIAVITDYAGSDAEKLIDFASLSGIWNFTDYALPEGTKTIVHNTTLGDVLMTLCCEMKNSELHLTD